MDNKWIGMTLLTFSLMAFTFNTYAENTPSVDDRAKLGEVYSLERLKEYPKAIPMIEDLYQHYADNREIKWSYVRVLGFGGHWREAMKAFDELCAIKCDGDMYVTYAHILEAQGPIPETLLLIKKLADQFPNQVKIQSIYAEILSWNAQTPVGQKSIEELSAKYPNDLKIAKAYAETLVGQKKYTAAITQMDNLLTRNPNDPDLRYQHAKVVSATGDHERAVKELKALLNNGIENKEAAIMLGDELRLLGRDEESLKVYQGVINEK